MKKFLTIIFIACHLSFSMGKPTNCQKTLQACEDVVEAQDKAIENLKKQVVVVKQELEAERKSTPSWIILLSGIAIGIIVNSTLK